ncbi:MAG: GvpL/GvpF family gas vesicle protein, partial [Chloroflexota bacterium]
MRQDDGEHAFYVYAVARPRQGREPGNLPTEGIVPPAPVYTVAHRDLLAVVSPVSLAEFSPEALETNLQDTGWAQARVLAHQRVLAGLLNGYVLIPLKFCTLYASQERLFLLLTQHHQALDDAMRRLEEATEWGVKLFCNRRRLVEWVQEHSEAL